MSHLRWYCSLLTVLIPAFSHLVVFDGAGGESDAEKQQLAVGKELFMREWLPDDKRSHAGDGLGPVHNARSCVACHHQGSVGGAGPRESNAVILAAFVDLTEFRTMRGIPVQDGKHQLPPAKQPDRNKLAMIHPALRTEGSFPLHRFSTEKEFEKWKTENTAFHIGPFAGPGSKEMGEVKIALIPTERNTPPLFGQGLIDKLPDRVFENAVTDEAGIFFRTPPPPKQESRMAPTVGRILGENAGQQSGVLPVVGRIARLKDGRIGRFGWKANVATVREFTLQACSNELGLEVPGFHRAIPPWKKDYQAPGLDLTAEQCDRLIQFVAALPRPVTRTPESKQHAAEVTAGARLFSRLGCAVCHRPKMGDIDGIYSDLLLHDMGQSLSSTGNYGTTVETPKSGGEVEPLPITKNDFVPSVKPAPKEPPKFGASEREWRTPPLWGLRDSAPYLHDGRAPTIVEAIIMHDGEGLTAAEAFKKLAPLERLQLELFLQSLAAPPQ